MLLISSASLDFTPDVLTLVLGLVCQRSEAAFGPKSTRMGASTITSFILVFPTCAASLLRLWSADLVVKSGALQILF